MLVFHSRWAFLGVLWAPPHLILPCLVFGCFLVLFFSSCIFRGCFCFVLVCVCWSVFVFFLEGGGVVCLVYFCSWFVVVCYVCFVLLEFFLCVFWGYVFVFLCVCWSGFGVGMFSICCFVLFLWVCSRFFLFVLKTLFSLQF